MSNDGLIIENIDLFPICLFPIHLAVPKVPLRKDPVFIICFAGMLKVDKEISMRKYYLTKHEYIIVHSRFEFQIVHSN